MSFIQFLLLFRSLPIRDLLDYPDDLRDEGDVRRWLLAACKAGDALADLTNTEVDDSVVAALKSVVGDAVTFGVVYSLILDIFDYEGDGMDENSYALRSAVSGVSDRTGMSPAMIIAVVQIIIMVLRFIRDRRAG